MSILGTGRAQVVKRESFGVECGWIVGLDAFCVYVFVRRTAASGREVERIVMENRLWGELCRHRLEKESLLIYCKAQGVNCISSN
jgi:hypothetical protein